MSMSGVFRRSLRAAENVRRTYSTFRPPRPSRIAIKPSHSVAALLAASLSFYTVGSLYPPSLLTLVSPRPAPPPPDPNLPSSQAATRALEEAQENLPILQKMRSAPDADEWYETRPYAQYPEARKVNSLTGGALRGPGKLAVPPLVRARKDEREAYVFIHVGRGVCGHDGIIHGGLIATLLDEALGRNAIVNLPEKIGVTANLSIDYKAPTRADQFIVIHTTLVKQEGRKAYVKGRVEDLQGVALAEGTGLFVQPRYAQLLSTAAVKQVIGQPVPPPLPVPALQSPVSHTGRERVGGTK